MVLLLLHLLLLLPLIHLILQVHRHQHLRRRLPAVHHLHARRYLLICICHRDLHMLHEAIFPPTGITDILHARVDRVVAAIGWIGQLPRIFTTEPLKIQGEIVQVEEAGEVILGRRHHGIAVTGTRPGGEGGLIHRTAQWD